MRAHYVIAAIIVFATALGAKQFLFPSKQAAAGAIPAVGMNVLQMHRELNVKNLPVQDIRDETFVFDENH
jgi:hypothetical protein